MSRSTAKRIEPASTAEVLDRKISEEELDLALAEDSAEIESLLEEARAAKARGDIGPLEPLHVFLRRARERLKGAR